MTSPAVRPAPRRSRMLLAAVVAFFAVVFGIGAQQASAHDSLVESSPAAGASVETAPETATLTFSAEVQSEGTLVPQVVLLPAGAGADAAIALDGAPTVDGTVVTQPLPALAAGEYALNWQVVSSDGHPISGTIPFTVSVGASPAATPTATASAATGGSLSGGQASPTSEYTAADSTTAAPSEALSETPQNADSGVPVWGWVLMGVAGVAIVIVTVILFRRKAADLDASQRRLPPPEQGTGPADSDGTDPHGTDPQKPTRP